MEPNPEARPGEFVSEDFTAILLLADFATVADAKLTVVGAGWSFVGPEPHPTAIAFIIYVPWNETNRKHKWNLALYTSDGTLATIDTPVGKLPINFDGELEAGRPLGAKNGRPISIPMGINIGPLSLIPGQDYVWKLSINGRSKNEWMAPFSVRSTT